MAYIVKQSARRATVTTTSPLVVPIAPYVTGDHVAVFLAIQGSASAITTPAGFTAVGTLSRTGSTAGQWFVQKMASDSTSESTLSVTFSGSGTGVSATSVIVRGVKSTWLAGIASGVDYLNTGTSSSATFSTAAGAASGYANGLMLVGGVFNGSTARCYTDALTSISLESNSGNTSHFVGFKQQPATSYGSPAITAYRDASGNSQMCVLIFDTATGAALQPNCLTNITEVQWYGAFGVNNSAMNPTWGTPDAATIDGIATYTSATGMSVASSTFTNPDTNLQWNGVSAITITTTSVGASDLWLGRKHAFTTDLTGNKCVSITWQSPSGNAAAHIGSKGIIVKFQSSASDWVAYQLEDKASLVANAIKNVVIQIGQATPYATSGTTIDWANLTDVTYQWHRVAGVTTTTNMNFHNLVVLDPASPATITGGGSAYPATWYAMTEALKSWNSYRLGFLQSSAQAMTYGSARVGDGSKATYWDSSSWSLGFPQAYNAVIQNTWRVAPSTMTVSVKAASTDTINMVAGSVVSDHLQSFNIDAATSTSCAHSFAGLSIVGLTVTDSAGLTWTSATLKNGGEHSFAGGADLTDTSIGTTVSTDAALSITANNTVLTRDTLSSVNATGGNCAYTLELGASVTAIPLTDVTFSGSPTTNKVHVLATTGTVTITISGTTDLATDGSEVTSAGASIVVSAPTYERGLEFTGLVAGSQVKVFTTGTDTELFSDNNSSTTETFDDATSGTITVDYVIQKAGYLPIRVTGVSLTGAVGTGVQAVSVQQQPARWYAASSGLTINTNCYANATTKLWGLTAASTLQNLASYLMEQWIALGDSGEAFANKAFPIEANGPNSFTWLDGWEADTGTYAASISNLSRDGMRYKSASGAVTAVWASILTSGVPSGARVRYQQSDGGTTVDAAVSSGNMDELVKIYGDATHGNFDKTGYLVLKVQEMGYDQAEADAVTLYGTLEDQLYVVGLAPTANGVATGNPSLSTAPAITTGSFSHFGKTFGIKITDGATPNTGEGILRWLRYNFETGGAFQSRDAFDWHDLVQVNGTDYKTVRGNIYGTAAVKGVVVLMADGATIHPDFNLLTADDGTTYSPPVTADISITGMPTAAAATTRLQIINQTALSAAAWQAATAYAAGDLVLRTAGIGTESTAGLYMRCTTAGTSHATTEPTWDTTVGNTTTDGTATWTTYAVLFYDADPVTASLTDTYIDGKEFLAGETVELRFAEMDEGTTFKRYHTTATVSSAGFSITVNEEADTVYAGYALDGSDFDTTFSPDYVATYLVLDTNTDFSGKSSYSYYCYLLTTSQGMYLFWDGYTALDAGNLRIETDVLDMYFDESSGFVKQTDDVRIFRSDGLRPALDPTTGGSGIEINWRTPVSVVIVSTSDAVISGTAEEIIAAIPSAATIANEVVNVVTF